MTIPNGKLIAIGGAEDQGIRIDNKSDPDFTEAAILRRIVTESGGRNARIEIITTASIIPKKTAKKYLDSFKKIGCTNLGIMHIENRKDISADYYDRLTRCKCILFSGGTQMRLNKAFRRTDFLETLNYRYQNDHLIVAGTSAGAMAMGHFMIYQGNVKRAHLKGIIKTTSGFNLLNNVILDSHFEKSARFGRLAQVIAANPSSIGIGLGEDTGVIITKGNFMEVIGSGWVVIIDGSKMRYTNVAEIQIGHPISIENFKVHFCIKGNGYIINERKFLLEATDEAAIKKKVDVE